MVDFASVFTESGFPYFECIVALTVGVYVFETLLDIRQYWNLHATKRPAELLAIKEADQETFDKAQSYGRDKMRFGLYKGVFNLVDSLAWFYLGVYPVLWNACVDVSRDVLGYDESHEIVHSVVFFMATALYSQVIGLPFSLYYDFVVEERHGFNKKTAWLFVTDMLKSWALGVCIGLPVLAAALKLIKWGGEYFYAYVWAFVFCFTMVMMVLYPNVIQPMFNKVDPLPEGDLRSAIERLAESVDFPLKQLYTIDGSKRSSHSNAYFYGFCRNKRIVLFDTLLDDCSEEEIQAILCHELGHWKLNHTIQGLVIAQVQILLNLFLFGQVMKNSSMYAAFGFTSEPTFIGLCIFGWLYQPMNCVEAFAFNFMSRYNEFAADAFAVKMGFVEHLKTGLTKLHKKNLGNMNPDPWYSTYHYSHPPMVERLHALGQAEKKRE